MFMKQFIHSTRLGLFAAFIGGMAVFSGCQQTEEIVSQSDPQREVTFEARTNRNSSTRASETTSATIRSFNVFGIWSENSEPLINLAPASVSREGDTDWTYFPKQLWPNLGSIKFVAYSPDEAEGLTANYGADDYTDMSISYTVPGIDDQEDLLVAVNPLVGCVTPELVSLTFQHALSRVLLKARPAAGGTSYKVHSVAFLNLSNSGKLELTTGNIPALSGFDYSVNVDASVRTPLVLWTGQNTAETDYVFDFEENSEKEVAAGSDYSDIIAGDEALLVLPQATLLGDLIPIANEGQDEDPVDGKFYVKIAYASDDEADNVLVKYFAVREPLNPALNKPLTFEIGRSYTFIVDLSGSDYINFADVVVNDFDEAFGPDLPNTDINEDPDPATSDAYEPKAHTGFAGSNIYWDGSKLTFDDVGVTTNQKNQGLYFRWGLLIGVSPVSPFSTSTTLYAPKGFNGAYNLTNASALGYSTWTSFPKDRSNTYTGSILGYATYLNTVPDNLDAYKGDICAYLSGRPGIPPGYWRLPTAAELSPDVNSYTKALGGLSSWPSSASTTTNHSGASQIENGYNLEYNGTKSVFLPANGYIHFDYATYADMGTRGQYMTSTPGISTQQKQILDFTGTSVAISKEAYDVTAGAVRCVRK
jgi:hypothetical protein